MTGQDENKGGISSFSIGLGDGTPQAVPVSPPPPFRVLIAGDFGLPSNRGLLNITGLDVAEVLEENQPEFDVQSANGLGSHPAELEEHLAFSKVKDLRPATIAGNFKFQREIAAAKVDPDELEAYGQRYDKLLARLRAGTATTAEQTDTPRPSAGSTASDDASSGSGMGEAVDGLDALFSMVNTPDKADKPSGNSEIAKAAVDAFVRKTLREESQDFVKPPPAKKSSPQSELADAQSRAFFAAPKLHTVMENWHGLKLLLSELSLSLPFELHLMQLDHDLAPDALADLIGGYDGALQAELYDVVLFANRTAVSGQDAECVKVITRECAESDTVGLIALQSDFSGVPGEELADMEAAHQLLEEPGFESFQGLRGTDAASHVSLFWNDARLSSEEPAYPAVFASAAWIALSRVIAQLANEVFPHLPVGVPADFDALEVEESVTMGRNVATAVRFHAGPGAAPSLAQCGINVLEGVANRTSLVFRRGVTLQPGKEGRGSLDQALLVSRLFSLFQEALGGALSPGQTADARVAAVADSLGKLSASLTGQVSFQVKRVQVEDQDLINVTASVLGGWASGQTHSFYLPAEDG